MGIKQAWTGLNHGTRNALIGVGGAIGGGILAALVAIYIAQGQLEQQREQLEFQKQQAEEARVLRGMAEREKRVIEEKMKEGPLKFVQGFRSLIDKAAEAGTVRGAESKLIPFARDMVKERDALRSDLLGLNQFLNSDIDRLSEELKKPAPDEETVHQLIGAIRERWRSKEAEILRVIERLQATLRILQNFETATPER